MVAVQNTFGESGQPQKLMDKYSLNSSSVVFSISAVLTHKRYSETIRALPGLFFYCSRYYNLKYLL